MRRFLIAGACLAMGSCSLVVGLDGLSGGDTPSTDASAPDADGAAADVVAAEGGTDAGADTGLPTPFCANVNAAFCDDFDDPGRKFLVGPWDFLVGADGGAAVLETTAPRSPPRGARFTFAANIPPPATGCHYERLHRLVAVQSKSHLNFSFSAWLGDANGELEPTDILAHLSWSAGGVGCTLLWSPSRPRGALREQHPSGSDVVHSVAVAPAAGAWHHYAIDADLVSGLLRFEVDGVNSLSAGERLAATCPGAPTDVSMSVGFYCPANRLIGSEVRFDDVTFDAR